MKPLVLDFDGSVKPLPDELRIDFRHSQEKIRFGCRLDALRVLDKLNSSDALVSQPAITFLGSGDFHHLSYWLISRYVRFEQAIQVVVFDNHPDNMRYPFGIHCGSWVWHVSRLPFVSCVHVVGITSTDVEAAHGWENHLRNLHSGKVRYWCVGRDLGWMRHLGIQHSQSFVTASHMLTAFQAHLAVSPAPTYLSIDKDVLSIEDAHTNWDQGVMRLAEMEAAIRQFRQQVVACDVTGDISVYRYKSRFKRFLSGIDGQTRITTADLERWQLEQQAINLKLLQCLSA
jgi:arginase family enzyme